MNKLWLKWSLPTHLTASVGRAELKQEFLRDRGHFLGFRIFCGQPHLRRVATKQRRPALVFRKDKEQRLPGDLGFGVQL